MKKARVPHSTSSRNSAGSVRETSTVRPAPIIATTDGSRWSTVWNPNATMTSPSTTRQRTSIRTFVMASLGRRSPSRLMSTWADRWRRNSHRAISTNPISRMIVSGSEWTRKSTKLSPARLPMMMFGGSPMRVAVPPMLDARIREMRYGAGSSSSWRQTESVTGATSSTQVTLSRMGATVALTSTRRTSSL